MKILVLSDLHWNDDAIHISDKDIELLRTTGQLGETVAFYKLREYLQIILSEEPQLILFAGDLTGDGSCGHGFFQAFKCLLTYLEISEIPSYFIRGNHDVYPYYEQAEEYAKTLNHCKEISGQYIIHQGLKILGIPFDSTKNKKKLTALLSEKEDNIDIVLSHCELKRRTWLFDFKAEVIITGHYDNKQMATGQSIFLSFSNDEFDFANYGCLDYSGAELWVTYNFRNVGKGVHLVFMENRYELKENNRKSQMMLNEHQVILLDPYELIELRHIRSAIQTNQIVQIPHWELIDYPILRYFRGIKYQQLIQDMRDFKNNPESPLNHDDIVEYLDQGVTAFHKVSRSMLIDYLGEKIRKELFS